MSGRWVHPADASDPRAAVQALVAARFPAIAAAGAAAAPEIRALEQRLLAEDAQGIDNRALREVVREWRWRLEYTGDAAAAAAAGARARRLAALAPGDAANSADAGDLPWFLQLDAAIDDLLAGGCRLPIPALFDRANDPARLRDYLDGLLLSRPEVDGVDRRKELNLSSANLVRLVLWQRPVGYDWDPRLQSVVRAFIAGWQDPGTGFFGARYDIAGRRFQTTDLSITFHIARYLDGRIGGWPQLIDTLLAIGGRRYPNGWLADDGLTAHNAYDVAALVRLGWLYVDTDRRGRAAVELARLTRWCLGEGLGPDGRVVPRGRGESLPETCYFTIALLDAVGFFEPAPFWREEAFAEAAALRPQLSRQLAELAPRHPMTRMAVARLARAGRPAAAVQRVA